MSANGQLYRNLSGAVAAPEYDLDLSGVTTLLCDADGTLFPSEEPAFLASAEVTRDLAGRLGLAGDFSAENLRRNTTGKNFRTMAQDLIARSGGSMPASELEAWVEREKNQVSHYLAQVLSPREDVLTSLQALHSRYRLAAVSSSALSRLDCCFRASGLQELLPPGSRFSAEDSLPRPTSKPDPAIYARALKVLNLSPSDALAIEDSATGARSAIAAGVQTIGIVQFFPPEEQDQRRAELRAAGCGLVVGSWQELTAKIAIRACTR
jgi:beta-phosphoglucomutase-like phosphatase (HAD superfamily)